MRRHAAQHVMTAVFGLLGLMPGMHCMAWGQSNPLGDGRLLDANLSLNTRYNAPRQGFVLNRINDSIVTGTAGGGRSFRGNVGYGSAFEFRGATAGDRLYDFQRDSIFSGSAYRRSMPRSFQPAGGLVQVPRQRGQANAIEVLRPTTTANLSQLARNRYGSSVPSYDAGTTLRTLRQSGGGAGSDSNAVESLIATNPSLLQVQSSLPKSVVTSDPLLDRGNTLTTALRQRLNARSNVRAGATGLDAPTMPGIDRSVPRDSTADPLSQTFDGMPFREGLSNRLNAGTANAVGVDARVRAGQDSYTDYVARMAARKSDIPLPARGESYSDELMSSIRTMANAGRPAPASESGPSGGGILSGTGADEEADASALSPIELLTPEMIVQMRGSGSEVKTLSGSNESRFSEQINRGEKAMNEGRYFDADQWFDVALAYSPGHPFAIAGKVHAQLGAGMYRSAALNLRLLFEEHPELIGTRYAAELLPDQKRLAWALNDLDTLIEDGGGAIESGLVVAYLGYLLDRPEVIERGLADLADKSPEDVLGRTLRTVWLAEPEDQ